MVIKRKKKTIDGMDRSILRSINNARRSLSSRQIAQKVKLSPSAISPRLNNLKSQGILKPTKTGMRIFKRKFPGKTKLVQIKAPRSILWGLDIKKSKKGGK